MTTGDAFRYKQVDPEAAEKMNCRPKNGNHRIGEFPDPKFENLTNNIFVNVFEVRHSGQDFEKTGKTSSNISTSLK